MDLLVHGEFGWDPAGWLYVLQVGFEVCWFGPLGWGWKGLENGGGFFLDLGFWSLECGFGKLKNYVDLLC